MDSRRAWRKVVRSLAAVLLAWAAGPVRADDAAAWFDAGRPRAVAQEAAALLADAASHGLDPRDYEADALQAAVVRGDGDAARVAVVAEALSQAMRRYLADLHDGRIDPRRIHHDFAVSRAPGFDPAALLRGTLQAGRLADAVRAAAPSLPLYGQLREALARYRGWVDHPAWAEALPRPPGGRLDPGQAYAGLGRLAQRLAVLGDLAADAPPPSHYEGALVDALRGFQRRHGLADDGVLGRATRAQLDVTPAARVRQIELTLERLRWTPLMQAPRMVVINIPEFVLRAYEVRDGRIVVQEEMRVIVGKALDTRTPLFDEQMRAIEFSPHWNVPASIARQELLPRLRRDPGYFDRQGFEFVAPGGRVETALSDERLDALDAGALRLRQRPGAANALGDIKFVFPNREAIYLHHTPSTGLFARDRRDFSHGCIRVERPVALAQFVLRGQPEWTEERIRAAMAARASSTLRLAEPLPVLIAYGTTLVRDGRIHFFDDLYGHDRALAAALRRRPALATLLR
ncbi:MAG TPA: L,D-transpeptidase family protein [Methylibium sp.]|nr:L,D-transpeptidase family protein [Methylibium sp.]